MRTEFHIVTGNPRTDTVNRHHPLFQEGIIIRLFMREYNLLLEQINDVIFPGMRTFRYSFRDVQGQYVFSDFSLRTIEGLIAYNLER